VLLFGGVKLVAAILLFAVSAVGQPISAEPQLCNISDSEAAMSCEACCAVNPCCIFSQENEVPERPDNTFAKTATDQLVLGVTALSRFVVRDFSHEPDREQFDVRSASRHSPAPLALNCVRLI
jgi:hypothetical protein